eukprot:5770514-Prymnesium_polylepis.1
MPGRKKTQRGANLGQINTARAAGKRPAPVPDEDGGGSDFEPGEESLECPAALGWSPQGLR